MCQPSLFDALPTPALEVLGQVSWEVHWGGINNLGGLAGKLTRCRLGALTFYVRENVSVDHFNVSGGERQAFKRGSLSKRHPQVLELCCPADEWEEIARVVAAADGLGRPVRRNRNFTYAWAARQFKQRSLSR